MAEASVDTLVTPEKGGLDDRKIKKDSTGNQDSPSNGRSTNTPPLRASVGALRRSAVKSESDNSSQKVVPHYLRASTGSCHDFCKFGKHNSDETKARKPIRKRIAKLSPVEIPVEILVSGGNKKKEVVLGGNKKEEVVLGGQTKGEVVTGGEKKKEVISGDEKKEEVVNHGPPIDAKVHSTGQKPSIDTKSYPTKPKTSLSKEKATNLNPSTYTNDRSPSVPSPNNKSNLRKPKLSTYTKTYPSKQNDSSGCKTLLPKSKSSSAKKSPSVEPPEIVKSVFFPYTEVEGSVKQGSSIDDKTSRTEKKPTSLAKQRTSPVNLKPVKAKPSSAPDDLEGMHGKGRRISNARTGRKLITAKVSAKKILAPPSATLPSKLPLKKTVQINLGKPGNLKLMSPLKDQNRIRWVNTKASNTEEVTEKMMHVVETGNNVSESIPVDNVISSPQSPLSAESSCHGKSLSLSSHEDDNSDLEEIGGQTDKLISKKSLETDKEAPVKESHKKTMRKTRVVVPVDKHVSPVKVKFRMGKVVELQSDNNTPRKLRFRRARVLGVGESKGDLRRKTTKKAGVTSDTAGTGVTSQKVVLKHQDVQGKKDAQGLLNNVIEETASKLVESRKSKVKALVGAFETVISLQESKPSTQVVS